MLQTLILGFNSLSDLSDLPWAALTSLESLDLSSNRLRSLGDVVLMTWLRRLNLENNEISPVPLELGLCTGEQTANLRCSCEHASLLAAIVLGSQTEISTYLHTAVSSRKNFNHLSVHPLPRRSSCVQCLPPKTR